MPCPKESRDAAWAKITKHVELGDITPVGKFLGCQHTIVEGPAAAHAIAAAAALETGEYMTAVINITENIQDTYVGNYLDDDPMDTATRERCFPDKKEQTLEDKLWNYNPFHEYDETDQGGYPDLDSSDSEDDWRAAAQQSALGAKQIGKAISTANAVQRGAPKAKATAKVGARAKATAKTGAKATAKAQAKSTGDSE